MPGRNSIRLIAFASLVCVSVAPACRAADYQSLLPRLPGSTNAVVLLDAEGIFSSAYGKQQSWRGNYAKRFDASPSMLPPTTTEFAWGGELNLAYMTPTQQVAMMHLSRDLSMPQLAKWRSGQLQEIDGLEAVATPRGGLVVKFSTTDYGILVPGNRQKAARWIREAKDAGSLQLSPYLSSVVTDPARTSAHLCQAIDLTDAVDRRAIESAMANSAVVKSQGLDAGQVAELLAGVRGVNVLVTFSDKVDGQLIIDFSSSPKVLGNSALALVLEILDEAGASIDEIPSWTATTAGNQLTLSGPLGESGLTRLFSFLEVDAGVMDADAAQATAADAGEDNAASDDDRYANDPAKITQNYYNSVQKYLTDLRHERGAKSYYSIAVWYDKYARRIEKLPILNVDPGMLDYSEEVIGHLRSAADSIQAGGVRTGARSSQVTASSGYETSYSTGYGSPAYPVFSGGANYAASQVADMEAQRRAIRNQEKAQSTLDAKGHIAAIEEDTLRIRREMTEKYGIEF